MQAWSQRVGLVGLFICLLILFIRLFIINGFYSIELNGLFLINSFLFFT